VKKSSFDEDSLEGEEGLDATAGEVYPDATVKISRNQYSIFEIKHMLKDTKELIIDPDFQRNYVWKIEQERELIESVLMGSPFRLFMCLKMRSAKSRWWMAGSASMPL